MTLRMRLEPHSGCLQYGQTTDTIYSGVAWFDAQVGDDLGKMIELERINVHTAHYATFIGYLALALGVAESEEILGDYGMVHECIHALAFDPEDGMTLGGSPCSHTRESLAKLAADIQQRVKVALHARRTAMSDVEQTSNACDKV